MNSTRPKPLVSRCLERALPLVFAAFAMAGATCEGDDSTEEEDQDQEELPVDMPPSATPPAASPSKQGNDHVV